MKVVDVGEAISAQVDACSYLVFRLQLYAVRSHLLSRLLLLARSLQPPIRCMYC